MRRLRLKLCNLDKFMKCVRLRADLDFSGSEQFLAPLSLEAQQSIQRIQPQTYLFIWLHQVLVVACRIFSYSMGFFFFSVVSRGIQFPDQGSNPGPLHCKHEASTAGPPVKSLDLLLQISRVSILLLLFFCLYSSK